FLAAGDGAAAAGADGVEHHEIADGGRHTQTTGDCVRAGEHLRETLALLERSHNRSATVALTTDETRQAFAAQPTQLAQLGERLPHTNEAGTASGRIENHIGQPIFRLLRQLQAHRLLAFETIRLLERGHVEPAEFCRTLADNSA